MLSKVRKAAFFLVDALSGKHVWNALQIIEKCDHSSYNSQFVQEYQKKCIEDLVVHARNTTLFYANLDAETFDQFPVINKVLIKDNYDLFFSSSYNREQLVPMHTSGSTGIPFTIYQDVRKKKQVNAECIYYSQKIGYDIGKKLCYLRSVVRQVRKSKLKQFLQNQPLILCNDLSDIGIQNILKKISESGNDRKTLLAYASTLDAIANFHKGNNNKVVYDTKVSGVISGAEMLNDHTRRQIEQIFDCKCVSRYSNEENGVLGQDDDVSNVFLINEASYYIEVFEMDRDVLAPIGKCGRIVVTDLYNRAMPMIRYDTGDVGAIEVISYNGKQRRAISCFGGRKIDSIYSTAGVLISPHAITNLMWSYPEIKQFQLIQTGKTNYVLKINGNYLDAKDRVIVELQQILGDNGEIQIEYVSEIPVLQSGKRKYILNKCLE